MQSPHLSLEGGDLGWGAPGLSDDLGWGGEATRDAQECGGGPLLLRLLERGIREARPSRVCSVGTLPHGSNHDCLRLCAHSVGECSHFLQSTELLLNSLQRRLP